MFVDGPYYPALIGILLAATTRVQDGAIHLTDQEAALLRQCRFPTATTGRWQIPPVPLQLLSPYPLLAPLVDYWWAPRLCAITPAPCQPSRPAPQFWVWSARSGSPDQRRVLA